MKKNIFIILSFIYIFLCNSCENLNNVKQETSTAIENCVDNYVSKWNYKPALEVSVY